MSQACRKLVACDKFVPCKSAFKKLNADFEQFSNFRPVSNLKFLSNLIEKAVFVQLNNYLGDNNLHEPPQSAPRLRFSLLQMTLCCHWTSSRMFSLFYWICRQHLIPLTIPCCWHDCKNHLASVELCYNDSILIFLIELCLLTSMRRIPRCEIFP